MRKTPKATLVLATIAFATLPSTAQEDPGGFPLPAQAVRELAEIQHRLGAMVELLSAMRATQDAELVLRRIELHERRLEPLARMLESVKQDQIDARSSITDAAAWKQRTEDEIDAHERDGREDVAPDLRQQVVIAEAEIERLNRRLQSLQERQIELEDRLEDGRDEIDALDERLRELLD